MSFIDWLSGDTGYKSAPAYKVDTGAFQNPQGATDREMYQQGLQTANLQNVGVNAGQSDQARMQQQDFIRNLQSQANSTNGIASQWMNQQGDQAARQGMALMAAQRGINPAMAAREGTYAGDQARLQAAQQAGIMGMQERQIARGQLGDALSGMRGQDINMAGLGAQTAIQSQQLRQNMQQAMMAGMSQQDALQFAANIERQNAQQQAANFANTQAQALALERMGARRSAIGGLFSMGASGLSQGMQGMAGGAQPGYLASADTGSAAFVGPPIALAAA